MTDATTAEGAQGEEPTLFGHPTGLYTLFFAEMWERFSFYGMRALLVLYMIKGFLGFNDDQAYAVYAAYGALVYATPFIGGLLADRLLGERRAIILGGLLMAAGHLVMSVENETAFFIALALLICGNGFFKPNISSVVGSMYESSHGKRDAGFTIFYMGINLGAAVSPILCGYLGETYGWHYGFGLATIGMLIGLAVFVAPNGVTQLLVMGGALGGAGLMFMGPSSELQIAVRVFLALVLVAAAASAFTALARGGLSKEAGGPPDPARLQKKVLGPITAEWAVYIGALLSVPLISMVVRANEVAGWMLSITGLVALGYIVYEMLKSTKVERERLQAILVLMFFSMLFWAFFEQAGSSINNFTDRNVDRAFEARMVGADEVGKGIEFRVAPATDDAELAKLPLLGQEQLGHANGDPAMSARIVAAFRAREETKDPERRMKPEDVEKTAAALQASPVLTMTGLVLLRDEATAEKAPAEKLRLTWTVVEGNVGMGVGGAEMPASEFQAANPVFILIFGLLFSALWGYLGRRGKEPDTTVKFALGLLQLGLGFVAIWYGAQHADARGMVAMSWLLLAYLLHTTGELCLSPVGLAMVTRLAPMRLVSTVMGAWFLATAFSHFLAGFIAKLTGVSGGEGGGQLIPAPIETVGLYGEVFGQVAMIAVASAVVCFALAPVLSRWMHPGEPHT